MIVQNPNDYKFIGFTKSHLSHKKYDAILKHKISGQIKKIPFGSKYYEHYYDNTPLNLYSSKNHLDKKRRRLYRIRHSGEEKNKFSSGYWSWYYLW